MTTYSKINTEYPSRKRRLLANLSSPSTIPTKLAQRELQTDDGPNQLNTSKARHVLLACRDDPALSHCQNYHSSPLTCKVVQKVSENTWIELNVPCDDASLQEASNTIKQFATSYTSTSNLSYAREYSCPRQYGTNHNPSPKLEKLSIGKKCPANKQSGTLSIPIDSPICSICQGPAESLHNHYGARSCLSCRAFFRRSVQIEIYPNFTCSTNRKCVITEFNRSKCKLCRFEKCQEKGMKKSAVLSQDQKQARFRKHLEQKRSKQMEMKKILRRFRRNNHAV
ncbi:retinoic acid receptor RXR-gamma-A-like [Tigriopus californicus]|nr:retinoic acid receptor RXR-gamma-A-like [Tigriopus californicus]